ncbi:hypothetical protein Tco_0077153 [Tanacetum coccineum]
MDALFEDISANNIPTPPTQTTGPLLAQTTGPNNEFEELLSRSTQKLYPVCDMTTLEFTTEISYIKALHKITDAGFNKILALLQKACFPKDNLKMPNCPICKTSRWKDPKKTKGKKVANKSKENGKLNHPCDGRAWKYFDMMKPEFSGDPRNVRLSPRSPAKNIDVYLQPLIKELQELWKGVWTKDAATERQIQRHAKGKTRLGNFESSKGVVQDMAKAKKQSFSIMIELEKIFPPAFFDIMIHVAIHLPDEAILGGPLRYRRSIINFLLASIYGWMSRRDFIVLADNDDDCLKKEPDKFGCFSDGQYAIRRLKILGINAQSIEVDAPPVNDDNVNANEDNADFINNEDDVVAHVLDDDDVVVSDDDEVNPSTNVEEVLSSDDSDDDN